MFTTKGQGPVRKKRYDFGYEVLLSKCAFVVVLFYIYIYFLLYFSPARVFFLLLFFLYIIVKGLYREDK